MVEKNVDAEKNILSSLKDLDLYLAQLPDKMDVIRPLAEPGITRAKMAKALGCSESTVKRIIQTMISKNMIRRIGSNKKGEWIIVE